MKKIGQNGGTAKKICCGTAVVGGSKQAAEVAQQKQKKIAVPLAMPLICPISDLIKYCLDGL